MFFLFAYSSSATEELFVNKINIVGNTKTTSKVILDEIRFKQNSKTTRELINLSLGDLKIINLFKSVSFEESTSKDGIDLTIKVEERWTTIPIFKYSTGGGLTRTTYGVYDPNIYGQYIEGGFQIEDLSGAMSAIAWFKKPRLWGTRNGIDIQYWSINRQRILYDQNEREPIFLDGFLQDRQRIYFGFTHEFHPFLRGIFSFEKNMDNFSRDLIPIEIMNVASGKPLPETTDFNILTAMLSFGRLVEYNQIVNGLRMQIGYSRALSNISNIDSFFQIDGSFEYFKTFNDKWVLSQRLLYGQNDTTQTHYRYFLGGLDRIRGFADSRFEGKIFGLSNSEVRYAFYNRSYFILQAAAFVDLISVGEKIRDMDRINGASVGGGLRMLLPKFYRLILRMDYAQQFLKEDEISGSFGIQQFF